MLFHKGQAEAIFLLACYGLTPLQKVGRIKHGLR